MKIIITISRQFGSGGSIIGQKVAERLGFYYCDKDMIIRTALESGTLTAEEIRYYDERSPGNLRSARAFSISTARLWTSAFSGPSPQPSGRWPKRETASS